MAVPALKLYDLPRPAPSRRVVGTDIQLPIVTGGRSLLEAHRRILVALNDGRISPLEARLLQRIVHEAYLDARMVKRECYADRLLGGAGS